MSQSKLVLFEFPSYCPKTCIVDFKLPLLMVCVPNNGLVTCLHPMCIGYTIQYVPADTVAMIGSMQVSQILNITKSINRHYYYYYHQSLNELIVKVNASKLHSSL